jgi:hypothetical protein
MAFTDSMCLSASSRVPGFSAARFTALSQPPPTQIGGLNFGIGRGCTFRGVEMVNFMSPSQGQFLALACAAAAA